MAIPSKQIGWSQESNLLWYILKQLSQLKIPCVSSLISQTITCGVTDMAPSEDAVCQALLLKQDVLGKIRLSDPNGTAFTDLATAHAYVLNFTSATIYDESFNDGVYIFSVAPGTPFNNIPGFCNNAQMQFEDPQGLVNLFDDNCFMSNERNNIFGSINVGDNFLQNSSGNNTIVYLIGGDQILENSQGNNIINLVGNVGGNFLAYSVGNNVIGNVECGVAFLAYSQGNNIIGTVQTNNTDQFLYDSTGDNIMQDVYTGNFFLANSSGNNTINGEIDVQESAFENAHPSTRNSILQMLSCTNNFAYNYTGRMDIYYWGVDLGPNLPSDIFTTSNLTWILTRFYYKINVEPDVTQALTNIQLGNATSDIFYTI
jgi:hypothetical protein